MFNEGDRVVVRVPEWPTYDNVRKMHDGQSGTVLDKHTSYGEYRVELDAEYPWPGVIDRAWVAFYPESWLRRENPDHRRFVLQRDEDETGVSGTGVVAEGVEFTDGVVSLRWLVRGDAPGAFNPTSVVFHDNGIESVDKIHGHGGKTKIVWIDDE